MHACFVKYDLFFCVSFLFHTHMISFCEVTLFKNARLKFGIGGADVDILIVDVFVVVVVSPNRLFYKKGPSKNSKKYLNLFDF